MTGCRAAKAADTMLLECFSKLSLRSSSMRCDPDHQAQLSQFWDIVDLDHRILIFA